VVSDETMKQKVDAGNNLLGQHAGQASTFRLWYSLSTPGNPGLEGTSPVIFAVTVAVRISKNFKNISPKVLDEMNDER